MRFLLTLLRLIALCAALVSFVLPSVAQTPAKSDTPEKKFEDFDKVTKGAKEYDGLFKLYQKEDVVYLEIQPHQFNKPLLAPIAIARGMGIGGYTLNFDEQWVLVFKRVGDKVHLVRRNVRFMAKSGSPVAKAVETTYTDSVLIALPIKTINPARQGVLIDLNAIFFTDFAGLGGFIDPNRTTWHKIKAFPKNIELQVAATFGGGGARSRRGGGDAVIDPRGNTVIIHYGLVELPDSGYQPRIADDRVGYFVTAIKDFTKDDKDTSYVRYINRWRLERADGSPWKEGAKRVPPKKKIVFWIEKSVPDEYRGAVREGISEWNKAFEKIGFRDVIEVRQQENEDFEPEDISYSTFRWITTDQGFAMGPSRANPLTGEILDADIIFDASMVRFYKNEAQIFKTDRGYTLEPPSLIQAIHRGWMLPSVTPFIGRVGSWDSRFEEKIDPEDQMRQRFDWFRQGFCQCASHKTSQLGLALIAMAEKDGLPNNSPVSDEMIQQAIKEVTMHEVGHTLGLRHNFKASTMLKNEQLHDVAITRKQGLVGSVMDYSPVNLAPKGVKQGDYFTTTLGPYDYWAIEYGYKPLSGGTEGEIAELQKIASKAAQPGLDYATDEDLGTQDPNVNAWDLGSDALKFGMDRMRLAEELLKGLAERVVNQGEGYQRARVAFSMMLRQYGDAAYLVSRQIGGESLHRDHRGDPNARDPIVPIKAARQREALKFLQEHILTDRPFHFSPELLRKLAADRWMHWGNERMLMAGTEFPLYERILAIQQIVLDELLSPTVLRRVQNLAAKADKEEQPLQIAEIFRAFSDSIFADLPQGEKPAMAKTSIIRRNMQREYLKQLATIVLGSRGMNFGGGFLWLDSSGSVPPDARSLARMHLRECSKRIDAALADKKSPPDDTLRAHLEEMKEQITKILGATVQANEP